MLYQILWYSQTSIILITTLICIFTVGIRKEKSAEKLFILPYCIIDSIAMLLLILSNYLPQFPFMHMYITGGFTLFEMIFISFYINAKMRLTNYIIIPISVFILIVPISAYLFRSLNSFTFLITNIFIGIYVFKYINWVFSAKTINTFNRAPEYLIIQGISICYIGSIPYFMSGFISQLASDITINQLISDLQYSIYLVLNICMFTFFIRAFILYKISLEKEKETKIIAE